jgi:hypothetical protein
VKGLMNVFIRNKKFILPERTPICLHIGSQIINCLARLMLIFSREFVFFNTYGFRIGNHLRPKDLNPKKVFLKIPLILDFFDAHLPHSINILLPSFHIIY